MRRVVLPLVASLFILSGCPREPVEESGPELEDPALIDCIQEQIGSTDEDDLAGAEHLDCTDAGVESIEGLQMMTGLKTLSLFENKVWDLRPLAELTGLEELQLGSNNIGEIYPLASLTNLERLGLGSNKIELLRQERDDEEIEPLAGMSELRWLNLDDNRLDQDQLQYLCGLDELRWLTIEHNGLDDVDDELDCLDDLDELYWDYQEEGGGDRSFEDLPSLEETANGRLGWSVADDGALSFHYDVAGERHAVIPAFDGQLVVDKQAVFLERGVRRFEVGQLTADGIELCAGDYETVCSRTVGRKYSSGANRAPGIDSHAPVITLKLTLKNRGLNQPGVEVAADEDYDFGEYYNDMDPYVLASPNQWDAGSCLFMSNTGAMEILLNQREDPDDIEYEGDTDLSERYLMNGSNYASSVIDYSIIDVAYTYEYNGGSLLNRDFPFECTNSSCYDSNWDNGLAGDWRDDLVETPEAERTLLFIDPGLDQNSVWATGLIDYDVIERIKYELRTKNAPVILIHNYYLYWHAAIIVGYDDTKSTGCGIVTSSLNYFEQEGATAYVNDIENHMEDLGGCSDRGVFYVRDSIYDGDDEPIYDYGPWNDYYSDRIIEYTYNWALFMGNHAYSIHRTYDQ